MPLPQIVLLWCRWLRVDNLTVYRVVLRCDVLRFPFIPGLSVHHGVGLVHVLVLASVDGHHTSHQVEVVPLDYGSTDSLDAREACGARPTPLVLRQTATAPQDVFTLQDGLVCAQSIPTWCTLLGPSLRC